MDKKKIVETLFDKKVIKILRLFINNPDNKYYLREISRTVKVSPASTYRVLKSMKELKLIIEYKDKHLKTYSIDKKNSTLFSHMLEDRLTAVEEFVEAVKDLYGLKKIIKHGEQEKNKVNILLLGENIDEEKIRQSVVDIKQKYGLTIIFLVLSPDQYEQLLNMGLYPGKKETLYSS